MPEFFDQSHREHDELVLLARALAAVTCPEDSGLEARLQHSSMTLLLRRVPDAHRERARKVSRGARMAMEMDS